MIRKGLAIAVAFAIGFFALQPAGAVSSSRRVLLFKKPSVMGDAPQTTAFLARANAITTLDTTHTNAYKALINGGVADGWFQLMDFFFIGATQSSGVSLLNLCNSTVTAAYNDASVLFVADQGWDQNGSGLSSVNTNFNPTTYASPNYTQNSAHASVWAYSGSSSQPVMTYSGGNFTALFFLTPQTSDGKMYGRVNDTAGTPGLLQPSAGLVMGNRDSATARELYFNGANAGSIGTDTSLAPVNDNMIFLNFPPNNASGNHQRISAVSVGGSMTPTLAAKYYARLRTYMTAVGVP